MTKRLLPLTAALTFAACAPVPDEEPKDAVVLRVDAAGDTTRLVLSHSLRATARGQVAAERLNPDLDLGRTRESEFVTIGDVATFPDGTIAILDLSEQLIKLFTADGDYLRTIGRPGDGPGEFRYPYLLASSDDRLLVIQAVPNREFTVLTRQGEVVTTRSTPVRGDFITMTTRGPGLRADGYVSWSKAGGDDFSRRLVSSGDGTFVLQLQPEDATVSWAGDSFVPDATIWRISADLSRFDTVTVVPGVRLVHVDHRVTDLNGQNERIVRRKESPLFSPRPVWTVVGDRLALGHGTDSSIVIAGSESDSPVVISWPAAGSVVSDADQLRAGQWVVDITLRFASSQRQREWARRPAAEREQLVRENTDLLPFSDRAPEIVAAYGAGSCLWMAGFAPDDYIDGTSRTWVAINIAQQAVAGIVWIPRVGGRTRHVDEHAFYVSYRDEDAVQHLERYPLANVDCEVRG